MKRLHYILRTTILAMTLTFSAGMLSAQNAEETATAATEKTSADSLLRVIDSLRNAIADIESRYDQQRQILEQVRAEADSLRKYGNCDMSYVLNYGNALLYRNYNARAEDIANLLAAAPDSMKQKDWAETLDLARKMVQASNVSQDIRVRVFKLLESVPQSDLFAEDIREVLRNVPADMQIEYSLTHQAVNLIDDLPRSVTESDSRYATVRELLEAYPAANREVKAVLLSIQDHPDNSINITDSKQTFIKQIKSTQYYKRYYGKTWTIPYLNTVIDEALARLQSASSRVDLNDLINGL